MELQVTSAVWILPATLAFMESQDNHYHYPFPPIVVGPHSLPWSHTMIVHEPLSLALLSLFYLLALLSQY